MRDISYTWLQDYVNKKYELNSREIAVRPRGARKTQGNAHQEKVSEKQKGKLTIQCDELWSFVGNKENKIWIWLALDVKTREIVGVFIGNRSKKSAETL